jgi:hypothetical protein
MMNRVCYSKGARLKSSVNTTQFYRAFIFALHSALHIISEYFGVISFAEMSYNANDPNHQWQAPIDPNNQQQLQPFNQQAISSQSFPGGGNYQQNQQSYTWTDGNTQGQHHTSQQSWSWQGQIATPAIQSPPVISPPSMLMQANSHHQLHQQMHQSAMNHAQQALTHHQQAMNMHQNVALAMSNLTRIMQQTPQTQITYQSMSPQPQPGYQQSLLQHTSQQPQVAYAPALSMGSQSQSPPATAQQQQAHYSPSSTSPMASQHQLQYPQAIYQQTYPLQSPQPQVAQQTSQPTPLGQQSSQPQYNGGLPQGQ